MSNFRVTTNGVMRNYQTNLHKSHKRLSDAMIRVETHRQFNSYAEDPTRAARAFQTRRALWRANDQMENNESILHKFSTAFTAVDAIVDGDVDHPGFDGIKESLSIITGTAGAGRKPEGQVLLSSSESVLKMMNTTYGENFVFAGADGLNVPYSWGENGEVLYRGIPVDTPAPEEPPKPEDFYVDVVNKPGVTPDEQIIGYVDGKTPLEVGGKQVYSNKGEPLFKDPPDGVTDAAEIAKLEAPGFFASPDEDAYQTAVKEYKTQKENYQKLKEMAEETTYVDIGLGMEENEDGEVVSTSAYNSALSGLDFLGYGVDEDGDPLCFISLMKELGQIAHDADGNTGAYSPDSEENKRLAERANVLTKKLRAALDRASEAHVALDAECEYLESNDKQLKATENALQEERHALEQVDPADAITEMLWAQYCYNAALRVGNDVLSQSLLDYMK